MSADNYIQSINSKKILVLYLEFMPSLDDPKFSRFLVVPPALKKISDFLEFLGSPQTNRKN